MHQSNRAAGLIVAAGLFATLGLVAPAHADMAGWQKQVATVIAKNQTYPRSAQIKKEEGTARVEVSLDASGAVKSVKLVGPSGSDILDREAEKIIQKVGQFPAPPSGAMTLVVPIGWKL